ncbi:glycoside hydrolase family 108 protein [Pedobacter sp. WC2423]|uniref:glycoside hydrolase family 108 protein n=1 Tax=Pedobacter sp. WC2423 TaxID=3234142 RepID=UPI0034654247
MSDFKIAEQLTGINEGGYVHDPNDKGGETYAGISRNNWSEWRGWLIIDGLKDTEGISAALINRKAKSNAQLTELIRTFYKQNFWDINQLGLVHDQQLANTVYDFGVNSGTVRAAKYLQDTVNQVSALNLATDGIIGPITIHAVNTNDPAKLTLIYNSKRQAFYSSIAKGTQARFLKSWLSRIKPYKT